MERIDEYIKLYKALTSFMNDFCLLKEKNKLSQKEIAERSGTTQSAISRIETLNTNPSYKVLSKLAGAVNGELYLTPMGEMTITVPFGMQEKVKAIADSKGVSVKTLLLNLIKKEINDSFSTEIESGNLNDVNFLENSDFALLSKNNESFDDLLCA